MSAPPGSARTQSPSGGNTIGRQALTANQLNLTMSAAHKALADSGVEIGASKVARIIRRFSKSVARQGMTFHGFLLNEANLTPAQRRSVVGHPEWQRVIAYADPTGETAVNRAMRSSRG